MGDDFSLVLGGPLYQLYLRTRLARPPLELVWRRIVAFVVVTLVPPAVLSALTGRFASGPTPFVCDLTNLQFVTTLPLLVLAELVVHGRLRAIVPEFVKRNLVTGEDRSRFEEIVAGVMRVRNSLVAEVVLLLVAFTGGYWLWRTYASLRAPTWYMVPVGGSMHLTAAGWWLAFVSLPISRFLLLRWYFRLFLWYALLWRASRLRLKLNALHADRAAGLEFLEHSVMAFALVLLAQSAFFALMLGSRIWHEGAKVSDFADEIVAVVVFLVVVVLLPLTFFAGQLRDARLRESRRYGRLATRYADSFDQKWIAPGASCAEPLLGTSDIQSLSDLANSYDVVRTTRLVPFGKATIVRLAVCIALPLVALAFTTIPVDKLVAALVNAFV
ncbi:MAG TPA: hypothetical protein VF765_15170 [Polyangiaceae bacterium]